ncbi:hypothetical protein GCM10010199_70920 [Dactylosporangium roseum]
MRYPGAVTEPDTGGLISDAQVAEAPYTACECTPFDVPDWARVIAAIRL